MYLRLDSKATCLRIVYFKTKNSTFIFIFTINFVDFCGQCCHLLLFTRYTHQDSLKPANSFTDPLFPYHGQNIWSLKQPIHFQLNYWGCSIGNERNSDTNVELSIFQQMCGDIKPTFLGKYETYSLINFHV